MNSSVATEQPPLPDAATAARLGAAILDWHAAHGRHDLPWQRELTPYRVWVSEIMLQQTQVNTVAPFFERFVRRFPDVRALADAPEDEVLHHWTGLGYYARARNLHRAARLVCERHGGEFPRSFAEIAALPGIGRSTAGAILSIACGERAAILDGNVKRVLARVFAVEGSPAQAATVRHLWALAEALTPTRDNARYTQAIMDLGATVCTRHKPACALCPVNLGCAAFASGTTARYPLARHARLLTERRCQLLLIRNDAGEFLLEKRPPTGIWGGLWSFPEIAEGDDPGLACDRLAGEPPRALHIAQSFRHTFSHFHLLATPVHLEVSGRCAHVLEDHRLAWYKPGGRALGLAAPVKRLIEALAAPPTPLESTPT